MSSVQVSCPGCGLTITFKLGSSVVLVCDFCRSVVARGDRNPEDLGKVAYLVTTDSPLSIGLHGRYQGAAFEITGRVQLSHEAGGVWNEWYAAFPNDRWGWLAEAQGRFYLTFQQTSLPADTVTPFATLAPGTIVSTLPAAGSLSVTEKGIAQTVSAEGEIPYRVVPGAEHPYADLSGPQGEFATLDYSEESPLLFVGREVAFTELGFPSTVAPSPARTVEARHLSCPHCGGALTLRAPDKAERVTCPSCGSLLDINQGNLKFLRVLDQNITPTIPLGTVGQLPGQPPLTVIGFLQRSVEFDGTRYFWEEYLLYAPLVGFRWLVQSDDHWNFVRPIPPGTISSVDERTVRYDNKRLKLFQDTPACVEHVEGEFYWRVEVGETVMAADYVAAPLMLSREISRSDKEATGEVNWSLGTYLPVSDVAKAFALTDLPKPKNIGPNQPYPHSGLYAFWLQFVLIALGIGVLLLLLSSRHQVLRQSYLLDPVQDGEGSVVRFSEPFTLKARQNVEITLSFSRKNFWLDIEGDLINQQTDEAQGFSLAPEYYAGVEDGEAWEEGSRSAKVYLTAPEAGTYTLGLDVRWQDQKEQPATFTIVVTQGVPRFRDFLLTLIALSVIPMFIALNHHSFETLRWSESMFAPGDDEADDTEDEE